MSPREMLTSVPSPSNGRPRRPSRASSISSASARRGDIARTIGVHSQIVELLLIEHQIPPIGVYEQIERQVYELKLSVLNPRGRRDVAIPALQLPRLRVDLEDVVPRPK